MGFDKFFRHTSIRAIAAALPKEKLNLFDLSSVYGEDSVKKSIKNTGISEIRVSPSEKTASDYCVEAALKIFNETQIKPDDIDGIVFITTLPDYIVPHTSATLQSRLGLPNRVMAFDINYGCAGYVYGIFQASLLIETGYCQNVLLCVGDTPTKCVNPNDKSSRMIFGDGGSATILSKSEKSDRTVFNFYTDGKKANNIIIPAGAFRMPAKNGVTDILTFDKNGNGRTLENLFMNGMAVTRFIFEHVKEIVYGTLEMLNLPLDSIDLFAFHQANRMMLDLMAKSLDLPVQKVPFGAGKIGNTACASIPVMLSTLYPGINNSFEKVLICGVGSGLSCAASVIDLSSTEIFAPIEI